MLHVIRLADNGTGWQAMKGQLHDPYHEFMVVHNEVSVPKFSPHSFVRH